jgi:DNA-binding MarR family transcriptional regulator
MEGYFLPGDWLIRTIVTYLPALAAFLDISAAGYGGVLSGFVSTCAWLLLLISGSIAYQSIRAADHALTRGVTGLWGETVRRSRIAVALLAARLRRRKEPAPEQIEFTEDLALSRDELRALQLHAELGPGFALAVSEVASALGARTHQAQQVLERLTQLGLLDNTVGGLDGESAYTLTRTGRAFLIFRQLAPKK